MEKNRTRSVEKEVKEFIDSFESTEKCAEECAARQEEFREQLSSYMNCISNLFNDPRYVPIILMGRTGAVVSVNCGDNNVIQGIFGAGEACSKAIKELVLREIIDAKKADTSSEG